MPILNKDMSVCISLAGRPSNLGTRFHNFLYDELGLNFIYKAFTTDDIVGAVRGIRAMGIRGCSVSMPFKEAVIPLVDVMEDSAAAIDAINSVGLDYYLMKPWDPPEDRLYPVIDDLLADWSAKARPSFEGVRVIEWM